MDFAGVRPSTSRSRVATSHVKARRPVAMLVRSLLEAFRVAELLAR